jgi:ligand-binding sensor domain-containing protein/signal transduction histidine kinase
MVVSMKMNIAKQGGMSIEMLYRGFILLLLTVVNFNAVFAQKYNFINFNVENGLAQSQVTSFAQDKNNQLLIGTFGGLSIFDGSNFFNYNKGNGLPQNYISTVRCDKSQHIWIGTNNGIAGFDGKKFTTYGLSPQQGDNSIHAIETDAYNNVWAISNNALYQLSNNQFKQEDHRDTVTSMTLDNTGKLWIFIYHKGIFVFKNGTWHKEIDLSEEGNFVVYRMHFGMYSGTLFLVSNIGIHIVENGQLKIPEWTQTLPAKGFTSAVLEDSKGNIWLASGDGGAWLYSQQKWSHYTFNNGLTDDNIRTFYEDKEGNIWIGTNGSGIFRYTGSIFTYYDRSSGLSSPSIMSIAQNKLGDLFFASSSSGLYQLKNGFPEKINLPIPVNRINTIVTDSAGTLWIGADLAAIWKYNRSVASLFKPSVLQFAYHISNLYRYGNEIWVSSDAGLFKLQNETLVRANLNLSQIYTSIYIGKDSLLIGSLKGAYIYRTDLGKLLPTPFVDNSTTLCFESDEQNIYIGTDDKGVLIWNKLKRTFTNIGHKSGLTCDYVYSLLKDKNGNLWVGTGCGIDKITFTDGNYHIRSFGGSDGLLGVENNANASFEDREGYLWFGTTKGVFRYNPYITAAKQHAPRVLLQSVKLFSKDIPEGMYTDSTTPFTHLQWAPVLPPNQNHLTFSFKGIYLSNPEKIKYRYQLAGIDKNFTETDQNTVVYPNLPSGKYLFKVWASDADGNWYNNAVSYPFTINTPYYTTWYFRTGTALLAIGIFLALVYYRNRQKDYRRRWQEQLREEEQAIVRQKTAEDFHDEIGNKLTRINLLATIAESKLQKPPEEIKKILQQIQQNVDSLYNGSKDIIWSLQPDSDYLDEIIFRIRQNTEALLEGTDIQFRYEEAGHMEMHLKMPIDYSRNLIMIFKEAVNNAVKHAACTEIVFSVYKDGDKIIFTLEDNGKGYDTDKVLKGNGQGNMSNRAKRIGVVLKWESRIGHGSRMLLEL